MILTLAILTTITIGGGRAAQNTECTQQYVISRNETLTPPDQVESSRSTSEGSADKVLNFGYNGDDLQTWCTFSTDDDPHVIIHFEMPVVITGFLSTGTTIHSFTTLRVFHLTNFTLEFTSNETYVYYTSIADNGTKYFHQSDPTALFSLEEQIVTQDIRVRPVQWYDSDQTATQYVCLGLALFGCVASDGVKDPTTATSTGTMTTTASQPTAEPQIVLVRDYQVLEIALPTAILTIIIVTVSVVVGVLLCRGKGKCQSHHYEVPLENPLTLTPCTSPGAKVLDNSALYQTPSEGVERMFHNDLYGEDESRSYTNTQVKLATVEADAQYEYVSETPFDDRRNSMEDNSAYVVPQKVDNGATPGQGETKFRVERNNSYGANENTYEETTH